MFHQVRVAKVDRESQRFLWMRDEISHIDTYEMVVMTFGAACSPSAAQFVKNHNAEQYADRHPRAAQAIQRQHYVDDYLDSFTTAKEALSVAKEVRFIHNQAGFEIRGWLSNENAVLRGLNTKDVEAKNLDVGAQAPGARVLGLWWDTRDDTLTFAFNPDRVDADLLAGTRRPTKREILRVLMMVFDPLGLIANLIVQVKILLQELWRSELGWDDPILDEHICKWERWIRVIPQLGTIHLARCYSPLLSLSEPVKKDIHIFVDASDNAYAAVAYLRLEHDRKVEVALVGAKTKVAPQKPISIPRLELQAAVLGVRLATSIAQAHDITFDSRTLWSDSSTVLSWLRSEPRKYPQFVALRIGEILETTNLREWRYVPTKLNVADEATKWADLTVDQRSRWFMGPSFLGESPTSWPPNRFVTEQPTEIVLHNAQTDVESATPDPEKFSKWRRLVQTQARILRVILGKRQNKRLYEAITPADIQRAEEELLRRAQKKAFFGDIASLMLENKVEDGSPILQLTPFLDDKLLLRVRGRVDGRTAGATEDSINAIILPRHNRITRHV